jgi:hypothetical protein
VPDLPDIHAVRRREKRPHKRPPENFNLYRSGNVERGGCLVLRRVLDSCRAPELAVGPFVDVVRHPPSSILEENGLTGVVAREECRVVARQELHLGAARAPLRT